MKIDSRPTGARAVLLCLAALLLAAAARGDETPVLGYEVVARHPHDPGAFTQGLAFDDGSLFEGTGQHGQSSLRRVDLASGEILQRRNLPERYFGEGIAVLGDRIFQLTWRSHAAFVWSRGDFSQLDTFYLPGEGWGITHDGERLIISDGSAWLRFLDPQSYKETGRLQVSDHNGPVDRLNELEYIDGEVWANVWQEDHLVRIDPATGKVNSRVDLAGLHRRRPGEDVLNGIAWDEESGRLFVTGKLWPAVYEIRVPE